MRSFKVNSLHDASEKAVEVGPQSTLLDLRYQLFSLTDIPPERILLHFAGNTRHPNEELDENATLISVGITGTTTVSFSDSARPFRQATAQPQASKSPKQEITLDDVRAALQHCASQRQPGARALAGASGSATDDFVATVRSYYEAIVTYEDKSLQEKALAVVPMKTLQTQAREKQAKFPNYEYALAKELLHWFKNSFFTWVDTPSCWSCGKQTEFVDVLQPTQTERKYKASRTELHRCPGCGAETRFPRYCDVAKLLETRRGRCGEWAKAFTLIARAAGLRARAVHDWTDHVWTEIWCGRWVHADPCEDVIDEPLMYEKGWKKKLNYCIATGVDCVIDVTPRYTKDLEAVRERRTLADEALLRAGLSELNTQAVWKLDEAERAAAMSRYQEEMRELALGPQETTQALPGRQSGSAQWVQSRGEDGSGK